MRGPCPVKPIYLSGSQCDRSIQPIYPSTWCSLKGEKIGIFPDRRGVHGHIQAWPPLEPARLGQG